MRSRILLPLALIVVVFALLGLAVGAQASPEGQLQQYATPTPGPDGRILYTVQAGDTCISVALKSNMSVEQLRALNTNLNQTCDLIVGQQLLLGLAGPSVATATVGPSPTPPVVVPTPTSSAGLAEVCVILFNDLNGNGLYEPGTETAIAGGAASLTGTNYSRTLETVINTDPTLYQGVCFTEVPAGEYTASMAIPDEYNATMGVNTNLPVAPGDTIYIDFGAQARSATVTVTQPSGRSPLVGIIGGVLLLGGLALGWYAWSVSRPQKSLLPPK